MSKLKQITIKDLEIPEIVETINKITKREPIFKKTKDEDKRHKLVSYSNICEYAIVFYFEDFYIISYFYTLYIFAGETEDKEILKIISKSNLFDKYVDQNCIGIILKNELLSENDFLNLKKCYMLTKPLSYSEDKIYCKYMPYHLIELSLYGNILKIYIKTLNCYCEINTSNINGYLKDFLKEVFDGMDEDSLKLHYQILKYYAYLE